MQNILVGRRLAWTLGAGLCLIPFGLLAGLVNRYGVNLPYSDQWELVLLLMKARGPGLELSDLFAQHGEQRMLFPRLIMIALASLTSWNIRAELLTNLFLAAGIFLVLALLLLRSAQPLGLWAGVPVAVLSLMVFSPVQWENWLWGWQISWLLPLLLFLTAAAVLWLWPDGRPAWPALALAIPAAVVGQYSLLSATSIWLAGLVIFVFRQNIRKLWWVWACCGAVSTLVYLNGYKSPPSMNGFHMPPSVLLEEPARPLAYLLYLLGRPVLDKDPSYLVGGLFLAAYFLLAAYLFIRKRDRLQRASIWLAIGGYALALGLMTTAGRLGIGLDFAGSSRYTTIGILFMAATASLATVAILPDHPAPSPESGSPPAGKDNSAAGGTDKRWIFAILAIWVSIGGLFLADYDSEVQTLKLWHDERLEIKRCLLRATSPQDPCLLAAYPAPRAVFERAQFLQSIGWGGLEVHHGAPQR